MKIVLQLSDHYRVLCPSIRSVNMCLWIYLDALSGPGAGDLLVPGGQPVGVGCLLLLERALKSLQDVLNKENYTRIILYKV